MKVNILGTEYEIKVQTEYENSKIEGNWGVTERYSKEIIIDPITKPDRTTVKNYEELNRVVLRHEIVHAFFHEAGLSQYCGNEQLVDWIATQFPKLLKAFQDTECI